MKPTIGRTVHYADPADLSYPADIKAAIITGLNEDGTVSLVVFYQTGIIHLVRVPRSDEPQHGHWHWPPRV
jgi:hypothetical protein